MAAPAIFAHIINNLLRGLATMSRVGSKAALKEGANFGNTMTKGLLDGFMQRQVGMSVGRLFGRAAAKKVWNALHDSIYKYGKKTYGTRLASLLSGTSATSLLAGGNILGMFGGSAESLNKTMTSLTNKLGGLNYGEAGFLKTIMMRSNGMMNIFGSGRNGFATAQELLDNFAEIGKSLDIADFNAIADALGVDVATRKLIRDGEYNLLRDRIVALKSDVERQSELGKQQAKTAAEWDRMAQQWASSTAGFWSVWEKFKGSMWETIGTYLLSKKMGNKDDVSALVEEKKDVIDKIHNGEKTTWNANEINTLLPAIGMRMLQKGGTEDEQEGWIRNTIRQMGFDPAEDRDKISEMYARLKEYLATGGNVNLQEELNPTAGRRNRKLGYQLADQFYDEETTKAKDTWGRQELGILRDDIEAMKDSIKWLKGGEHDVWMLWDHSNRIHNGTDKKVNDHLYYDPDEGLKGEKLSIYDRMRFHKLTKEERDAEIAEREDRIRKSEEILKKKEDAIKAKSAGPISGGNLPRLPSSASQQETKEPTANPIAADVKKPHQTLPTGMELVDKEPVIEKTAITKEVAASHIEHNYNPQIHVAMDIHADGKTAKEIVQIGPQRVEEMYASADRQHMNFFGAKNVG